ncbi:MAG: metalloprotease TldD [Neisseriaceae bacterium]|nr:MAG: metalloprotease TldD [Neisseriaceae bacterium]
MINQQVVDYLLINNGFDAAFLNKQLNQLSKRGIDFADLYLQNTASESWVIDEGIIKSGSYAVNQGIGVRAVCGEKTFFSYANALDSRIIKDLVDNLYIEPVNTHNQTYSVTNKNLTNLHTFENPLQSWDSATKIQLLQNINQIARGKNYVTNVIASINLEYDQIYLARSDERHFSDIRPLIHLSITIIVSKGGKMERAAAGGGGRYSLDYFSLEMVTAYIEKAYAQAQLKLEAKAAPNGEMPVVLGNGWAGVILHEAVGHGLEGDFNRKGSSAFSGKIGQQVASKGVTIIDEGCINDRRGSMNIDDEGNPSSRTVLIEDGVLKGYLFDELNARLMNTHSTGNGRRESYASNPIPRMTNTYMLGGTTPPEEIIASVEYGLFAENFEGGQVDITSGQFVFNASVAWVIEKGKLAYPVKGCALVGNGPECLQHVTMIGNDLALDSGVGVCGKDGQSVPVGVGQPTIRLDGGLIVGG